MSALMVASNIGHTAVVDRLISAGADCDLKSKVRVPEGACLRWHTVSSLSLFMTHTQSFGHFGHMFSLAHTHPLCVIFWSTLLISLWCSLLSTDLSLLCYSHTLLLTCLLSSLFFISPSLSPSHTTPHPHKSTNIYKQMHSQIWPIFPAVLDNSLAFSISHSLAQRCLACSVDLSLSCQVVLSDPPCFLRKHTRAHTYIRTFVNIYLVCRMERQLWCLRTKTFVGEMSVWKK